MSRTSWPLPLLLPLLPLVFGCSISSQLNQIEREADESVDIICACDPPEVNGQTCEEAYGGDPFANLDRDCVEDALALDKESSKESLDCQLDVMERYNDCLRDKLDCDMFDSISQCSAVFNDFGSCPPYADDVQAAFQSCGTDDPNQ
ncbi:MAG: hypothetical protein R3A79_04570 [Nannocystaceae bacterium]